MINISHECPVLFSQLEEELSGIVEVIGMVSNKGTIMAAAYNMFREEKGISFGERNTLIIVDFRTAAQNSCSFMQLSSPPII